MEASPEGAASPETRASEGQSGEESRENGEGAERRFRVGVDFALGWGKVPFAVQNVPTIGTQTTTYTRSDDTRSQVDSLLVGASWEPREGLEFSARVPLSLGTFSPDGAPSRSAAAIGNVELEGESAWHLGESVELAAALGVALPTAQGDEIPDDLAGAPASSVNAGSYDRFSVARASALARGYEDNALLEPQRLGLIPKIALAYRTSALSVEPYVKVENLVGTSSALERTLCGGDRRRIEGRLPRRATLRGRAPGLGERRVRRRRRGQDDERRARARGRVRVGRRPYVRGLMIPVGGPPADAGFLALRLGASIAF